MSVIFPIRILWDALFVFLSFLFIGILMGFLLWVLGVTTLEIILAYSYTFKKCCNKCCLCCKKPTTNSQVIPVIQVYHIPLSGIVDSTKVYSAHPVSTESVIITI
jgi:hypothetical protein